MTRALPYRPDIDGLRAIAVLSVMAYHFNSNWLGGGFVGVDVFFVISGFVVTAALVSSSSVSVGQSTDLSIGQFITRFYARRLARIVPALTVVLTISALLASIFIPRAWLSDLSEETALYAFWGLSNWRLQTNTDVYFAPRAEFNPYTHTWSLGIEEQFYLLVPFIIFLWVISSQQTQGRKLFGWQILQTHLQKISLGILGVLTAGSVLFCAWATSHQSAVAFYFIGARFWELAFGALLFLLTTKQTTKSANPYHSIARMPGIASLALPWFGMGMLTIAFIYTQADHFPWPWSLLAVLGTVCLIGGAHADTNHLVRRGLSQPALVWIGKRSYSLYLWHWPILVLLRWTTGLETPWQYALALILTLVMSMFSYRFIEQPLRHNAWIEKRGSVWIITGFVLLLLAGSLTSQYFFKHLQHISQSAVSRTPSDWYGSTLGIYSKPGERQCQVDQSFVPLAGGTQRIFTPKNCTNSASEQTIYVLGDSHAGAIIPMLEHLSATLGIKVQVFSFQGKEASLYACSYLDLQAPMEVGRAPGCLEFNHATRALIEANAKRGDLVLLPSLRMQRYGDQWASFGISNMQERMYSGSAHKQRDAAQAQALSWITPLLKEEVKVIFIAPTPIFQAPTFRCADWFNAHNPICVGNNQQARKELETLRAPIIATMNQLANSNADILVWDPFPTLCPEATCSSVRNGRPLFFDGDHLSNYGNWFLYPDFVAWLRSQHLISTEHNQARE